MKAFGLLPADETRALALSSTAIVIPLVGTNTPVGRSAALLIGSVTGDGGLTLTITASTRRPVRLSFAGIPNDKELRETILQRIADDLYHTDLHGKPTWRKHMTLRLAEEIRSELQGTA